MDAVYLVLQTMGSCVVQICCFVVMYKLFMKKINQQFETQKDIFQGNLFLCIYIHGITLASLYYVLPNIPL